MRARRTIFLSRFPMSLSRVAWLAATLCVLAPWAGASEPPLTVADALSRALNDGFEAQIAQLETGRAHDRFDRVRGSYLPRVSINSQAGWSNRINQKLKAFDDNGVLKKYGLATLGSSDPWLTARVDQLVFDLSQWRRIDRERLSAEAAEVEEFLRRESVAYDVTTRYAQVVRVERIVALTQERLTAAEWLDGQAEAMREAGRILPAEREQVRLHRDWSEATLLSSRVELEAATADLLLAMGLFDAAGRPVRVVADSLPSPDARPLGDEIDVQHAPELRVLELQRQMAEVSLSAQEAERLPTVSFHGGWAHFGANRFDNFEDEAFVRVDFRFFLFDGFQTKSAISEAHKAARIARLRHQSALQSKRARVRGLDQRLEMSGRRLEVAERSVEVARERERLADLRLRNERAEIDEALVVREETARGERSQIDLRFDRLELWASLQRELGRLRAAIGEGAERVAPAPPPAP